MEELLYTGLLPLTETQTHPRLSSSCSNIRPKLTAVTLVAGPRSIAPVRVVLMVIFQAVSWRLSSGVSRLALQYNGVVLRTGVSYWQISYLLPRVF